MCLQAAVEITIPTRPLFNNKHAFWFLKSQIVFKIRILLTNFVKISRFIIKKEIFESHAGRTKTSGGPHAGHMRAAGRVFETTGLVGI